MKYCICYLIVCARLHFLLMANLLRWSSCFLSNFTGTLLIFEISNFIKLFVLLRSFRFQLTVDELTIFNESSIWFIYLMIMFMFIFLSFLLFPPYDQAPELLACFWQLQLHSHYLVDAWLMTLDLFWLTSFHSWLWWEEDV